MPLSAEQEQLEHELRVEQMTTTIDAGRVNIEKMRDDMAKADANLKRDVWKIVISAVVAGAALLGAGAALGNYFASKTAASPPPPTVIYVVPGQPPASVPTPSK